MAYQEALVDHICKVLSEVSLTEEEAGRIYSTLGLSVHEECPYDCDHCRGD